METPPKELSCYYVGLVGEGRRTLGDHLSTLEQKNSDLTQFEVEVVPKSLNVNYHLTEDLN